VSVTNRSLGLKTLARDVMAYKINLIENSEFIRITYSGLVTFDERLITIHEVCKDYYKANAKVRVLIDSRLVTQVMTHTEQEIFGVYAASREELKNAVIAVLINPGQIINQTVLKNSAKRGHQIQIFDAEKDAIDWLKLSLI
jgi:hypothetical protein